MTDKQWFELTEQEKVKEIYSKFTIKEFWDFWSNREHKYLEIRIQGNYPLIKETSEKFGFPYSSSGVYVKDHNELKNAIAYLRDKATIWFGINARKKNWNKWGNKSFGGGDKGGSSDTNVNEIGFIFIDIDRKIKDGQASCQDLEDCDILANEILTKLKTADWNKDYVKIGSGNGVQLIIKLDFSILLPELKFDKFKAKGKDGKEMFEYAPLSSSEFDKLRNIIKEGIGKEIYKYTNHFKKKYKQKNDRDLNAEIDTSGFNINRVGALPFTKNFKHDGFTWRGIIELKNNENVGLSDYVLSKEENVTEFKNNNIFNTTKSLLPSDRIRKGKLLEHKLVKFMLINQLPYGGINNIVWFQLKCLIRDSEIDINTDMYKSLVRQLEVKYKGRFSRNLPDKKFKFDSNVVNKYCINNGMEPLYELWPKKTKTTGYGIKNFNWEGRNLWSGELQLEDEKDIVKDMAKCREQLESENYTKNIMVICKFVRSLIKKYGEQKTKFFVERLFESYFDWS